MFRKLLLKINDILHILSFDKNMANLLIQQDIKTINDLPVSVDNRFKLTEKTGSTDRRGGELRFCN